MRCKSFIFIFLFYLNISLFGQVVINEVNVNPAGGTSSTIQSVKVCTASTSGNEYIELYNKSDCPVDISCFFVGWNQGTNALNGSFRFPAGTTIPGKGFLSVGGPNAGASINLYSYCSSTNLNTGNTRWYLNNGDGYVCLYNASGVAIDLVYWTFASGETSKYGTDSEISDGPTFIANPAGCTAFTGTMLPGPSSISSGSGIVFYAGAYPTSPAVLGRTVDGGSTWTNTLSISINACNGTCVSLGTCVLPVELKNFSISCKNNERIFEWQTLSEHNNKNFVIEQSKDGYSFTALKLINGANNSNNLLSYSTTASYDREFKYFRLKQIDYNGSFTASEIIYNDCIDENFSWGVYPNPFSENLFLKYNNKNNNVLTLNLFDTKGKLVYTLSENASIIEKLIHLPELASGLYFCILKINDEIKSTLKLIKSDL